MNSTDPLSYWDRVAREKTFGHPFDAARFAAHVPKSARVLDVGCGYGRVTADVAAAGWRDVVGVDPSAAMIARGREEHPALDLRVAGGPRLPFDDGAFGAALLFAVLTCVPGDDDQRALVAEVRRVLAPGGVLHVSDLPLQDDARNRGRYVRARPTGAPYGVFGLAEGVVLRHHHPTWLGELLRDFETLEIAHVDVRTMNGHAARAVQWLGRR